MRLFPIPPARQAAALRGVAALGLVAAMLGGVAGWLLLDQALRALGDSLRLTGDTLEALDASAGVAADTVEVLTVSLSALEQSSEDLDVAFAEGEALMGELAGLVRTDVADALDAVEGALPGIIEVAGTIDVTLGALSLLPFGPAYDPQEPFAASLGDVAVAMDGVPERLREQADAIEETASSLGAVGEGVGDLASQIASFETTLTSTAELLDTYDATIAEGTALVAEAGEGLGSRLALGRLAIIVFAFAFAAMQILPLHVAALAEERVRAAQPERAEAVPPPPQG